jgi:hypothetical protein
MTTVEIARARLAQAAAKRATYRKRVANARVMISSTS